MNFITRCSYFFYSVFLLLCAVLIAAIYGLVSTHNAQTRMTIVLCTAILVVALYVVPLPLFYTYRMQQSTQTVTTNTWIYLTPHLPHRVRKQWKAIPFRPPVRDPQKAVHRSDTSCYLEYQLFWAFCMAGQWASIVARQHHCQHCPYLARTQIVDNDALVWDEEYCPEALTPRTAPKDIRTQFRRLNQYLKAHDLYLVDLHILNIRVKHGRIKIVDGELVHRWNLWMCRTFYPPYTGATMDPYDEFDRIYWANEDRCPLHALWDEEAWASYHCGRIVGKTGD